VNRDDALLVKRCLDNDPEAVRALIARYQHNVFGLCFRMLGHRQDAEDVTQEVFQRLFRNLERWDPTRPLKPWLLKITANCCRSAIRSRIRHPQAAEFVEEVNSTEDRTDRLELQEELQHALQLVREEYRLCFILYYQQEQNCQQIAETLDCAPGTVKTWLYRVRLELAKILERRGFGPVIASATLSGQEKEAKS